MRDSFLYSYHFVKTALKAYKLTAARAIEMDLSANSTGGERSARCQGEQHQHEHEKDEPCFIRNGFHEKLLFYSYHFVKTALKAHRLTAPGLLRLIYPPTVPVAKGAPAARVNSTSTSTKKTSLALLEMVFMRNSLND